MSTEQLGHELGVSVWLPSPVVTHFFGFWGAGPIEQSPLFDPRLVMKLCALYCILTQTTQSNQEAYHERTVTHDDKSTITSVHLTTDSSHQSMRMADDSCDSL